MECYKINFGISSNDGRGYLEFHQGSQKQIAYFQFVAENKCCELNNQLCKKVTNFDK